MVFGVRFFGKMIVPDMLCEKNTKKRHELYFFCATFAMPSLINHWVIVYIRGIKRWATLGSRGYIHLRSVGALRFAPGTHGY